MALNSTERDVSNSVPRTCSQRLAAAYLTDDSSVLNWSGWKQKLKKEAEFIGKIESALYGLQRSE